MKRPRLDRSGLRVAAVSPLLLLLALVALQLHQAVHRVGVLRDVQRTQFLNAVERMNSEVASAVSADVTAGLERARHLAALLAEIGGGPDLLERLCRLDPDCLEARPLLPAPAAEEVAWEPEAEALRFRVPGPSGASSEGPVSGVELRLRAAGLLARVTDFDPIEGVGNALISADAHVVALDRESRELGLVPGEDLRSRYPVDVLEEVLGSRSRVRARGARLFVGSVVVGEQGAPLFRLVSSIPDVALAEKAEPARNELRAIVAVTLLSTAGLALAGLFLHRAYLRERWARDRSRALERKRALAERLATSERLSALGLLTAGVAHEINNPLEGLGNYVELLKDPDLAPGRRAEFLGRVEHGLGRIRAIVRQLLGFARPGSGSQVFDLRTSVRGAVELAALAPALRRARLTSTGLGEDDPPARAEGDAAGIEQVVLNLLLNAGRATGGTGHVHVALRREEDAHVLTVEDDGVGIAPEDLPRLFDPFFTRAHGDRADSVDEAGTGLGLSISYSIVQSHGGSITAANRPTGGACFEVRLADASAGHVALDEPDGLEVSA